MLQFVSWVLWRRHKWDFSLMISAVLFGFGQAIVAHRKYNEDKNSVLCPCTMFSSSLCSIRSISLSLPNSEIWKWFIYVVVWSNNFTFFYLTVNRDKSVSLPSNVSNIIMMLHFFSRAHFVHTCSFCKISWNKGKNTQLQPHITSQWFNNSPCAPFNSVSQQNSWCTSPKNIALSEKKTCDI